MKNLLLILCLCFTATMIIAQGSVTVTTTVTNNKGGTKDVKTTTSVDGKVVKIIDKGNVEDKDVDNTIVNNTSESLSFLKKTNSKVKAGPDGEGDVVIGKIPSGIPPIVLTTGDGPNIPDYPSNSIIYRYDNMDELNSNYQSDLQDAIKIIMK